jgi:coenzyme Q-binding protein COQ10
MSTKTVLRSLPRARAIPSFRPPQRSFITLPGAEAQSLSATRILPYSSNSLYSIIADVNSYSTFLPYCLDSKVTKWSLPDPTGKRWPSEGDLKVGWGGFEETFTSRLLCVPGSIVEALGGEARTNLPTSQLSHHADTFDAPANANNIFRTISTRWTVKPFSYKLPSGRPQAEYPAGEQTEVHLTLDFQFSNPIYAALSKAVAPKIAGIMIEAFELRARKLLDGPGAVIQETHLSKSLLNASKKAKI